MGTERSNAMQCCNLSDLPLSCTFLQWGIKGATPGLGKFAETAGSKHLFPGAFGLGAHGGFQSLRWQYCRLILQLSLPGLLPILKGPVVRYGRRKGQECTA